LAAQLAFTRGIVNSSCPRDAAIHNLPRARHHPPLPDEATCRGTSRSRARSVKTISVSDQVARYFASDGRTGRRKSRRRACTLAETDRVNPLVIVLYYVYRRVAVSVRVRHALGSSTTATRRTREECMSRVERQSSHRRGPWRRRVVCQCSTATKRMLAQLCCRDAHRW